MRAFGILVMAVGFLLAAYALTMDVSVHVPARELGYGLNTPAMDVANLDKMAQRQNTLIFSGVLAVVGAILLGFGSMQPRPPVSASDPSQPLPTLEKTQQPSLSPTSVSICPKCRSMGAGDATECGRCGAALLESESA